MSNNPTIWQLPGSGDVECIEVQAVVAPIARQVCSAHKLVYFQSGAGQFQYRGGDFAVGAGDLVVIPPGEPHGVDAAGAAGAHVKIMQLPEPLFSFFCGESRMGGAAATGANPLFLKNPQVVAPFLRLHQKPDTSASALELQTRLAALLYALESHLPGVLATRDSVLGETGAITRAREYIDANYADDISLADLARLTELNPDYLCRVFTRQTGLPPHAYQIARRVDHARSLLRRGLAPARVAADTGFYDQSHFTRHFRRLVHMSPAVYAARVRTGK